MRVEGRGGFSRPDVNGIPLTPWDISEDFLSRVGQATMAEIFRNYKDAFKIAYEGWDEQIKLDREAKKKLVAEKRNQAKKKLRERTQNIAEGKYSEKQKGLLKPIDVSFKSGPIPTRKGAKPPKGMTYASFTRYMNRWLNEGKIERAIENGQVKHEDFIYVDASQKLQRPVVYQLTGG